MVFTVVKSFFPIQKCGCYHINKLFPIASQKQLFTANKSGIQRFKKIRIKT